MARIFLSYRRDDTFGHTGRIFDHLSERFGAGRVFMDVEGIGAGENFAAAIEERLGDCDTVVAVIGKAWAGQGESGTRRVDDPGDYVRQEIESALRLGVELVPVLVSGAGVPAKRDLPESLWPLAMLNALQIDDRAFVPGVDRLIATLERTTSRSVERKRLQRLERPLKDVTPIAGTGEQPPAVWGPRLQQLLLLYAPSHPATWILHVFFYVALFITVVAPVVMLSLGESEGALAATGAYLGILALLRALAAVVEPGRTTSRVRRWWLLYKPPRRGTAVVHVFFFLMLFFVGFTVVSVPALMSVQVNDVTRVVFLQVALVLGALTFLIREVAAARDPLRPSGIEQNWFARALYARRPRRAVAWLPRVLFYASALILFILAPRLIADSNGDFSVAAIRANGGQIVHAILIIAAVIAARGWARRAEAPRSRSVDRTAGLVRQVLMLFVPSRPSGWVPIALFWMSVTLLAGVLGAGDVVLALLGLTGANIYYMSILATAIAISANRWGRLFDDVPDDESHRARTASV